MNSDTENDNVPARGYLTIAALPAGLLLGLGSAYLLRRVGSNEEYLRDAAGTLAALKCLALLGFAIASLAAGALIWSFRKIFSN